MAVAGKISSRAEYWRRRRERGEARAWARSHANPYPRCRKCGRILTRVGDTFYCLAPITGPGSCPDAYTD